MELIAPDGAFYESYIEAGREYQINNVHTYAFLDGPARELFERIEDDRRGRNLPAGYVPATRLWLVQDGEFVGEISIRHRLTDALHRFGGHIGYGIRYSHWNRGWGTTLLAMGLRHANEVLGLDRVLLTCNDTNVGSARVIEKNGGVLQDKIVNMIEGKERLTRRYWIARPSH